MLAHVTLYRADDDTRAFAAGVALALARSSAAALVELTFEERGDLPSAPETGHARCLFLLLPPSRGGGGGEVEASPTLSSVRNELRPTVQMRVAAYAAADGATSALDVVTTPPPAQRPTSNVAGHREEADALLRHASDFACARHRLHGCTNSVTVTLRGVLDPVVEDAWYSALAEVETTATKQAGIFVPWAPQLFPLLVGPRAATVEDEEIAEFLGRHVSVLAELDPATRSPCVLLARLPSDADEGARNLAAAACADLVAALTVAADARAHTRSMEPERSPDGELESLSELRAGEIVEVCRDFVDFDGRTWRTGTRLTFVSGEYFLYDGGHTLAFHEGTIRVAEIGDEDAEVVARPWEFLRRVGRA